MCWRHLCETGIRSEVTDSCVGSDEGNWLTQEHSLQVGGGESHGPGLVHGDLKYLLHGFGEERRV